MRVFLQDDPFLRMTLPLTTFNTLDLPFDTAEDGQEAVDMCATTTYNFILMDNEMPNLSGSEATFKLREMGFKGVIIGLTGHGPESPERQQFMDAGLDGCIEKSSECAIQVIEEVEKYLAKLNTGDGAASSAPADGLAAA
mmetsp:Transcript_18316/g.53426  ORF Transcript_18316/g.53426 Transcript_18316/m.53426 type:complete len:140 (-) Transcript_18316:2063-2482(-)